MKQLILKTSKYVTQDKKIPNMSAVLITDGTITASADDFILKELAPEAEYHDLSGKTLVPGFFSLFGDFFERGKEDGFERLSDEYLKKGITTVGVRNISAADLETLKEADKKGELRVDVAIYLEESASALLPEKMPVYNDYDGHIRLAGVSIYVDDMTPEASLKELYISHISKHQQVLSQVDTAASIEKVLNAYRDALIAVNGSKTDEDGNEKPKIFEDLRPIICGLRELTGDKLTLLQSLGFVPCLDLCRLSENEGGSENIYPARDIVRRGLAFAISHGGAKDAVDAMNMAVNRAVGGHIKGTEQTINTDQALLSQTLFAAYALFEDLAKGSLTMTKRADLVVLSDNPLEISDLEVPNLKVSMTVKGGIIA